MRQPGKTARPNLSTTVEKHALAHALVPIPMVCFGLVLVTDILYWQTVNLMWSHFSSWLLLAGLLSAALAVIAGAVDLLTGRATLKRQSTLVHVLGSLAVIVLAIFNALVHARDGWTAVVPSGLILSGVIVCVMIATLWLGQLYRHRIGGYVNG
ncbi:DUF2231 domain-containing protein [Roseovarius sp. B08]|uniref:DUF2231 domain-containing protein n=1 Tax=Roseovarius sp. B08 TaxID=3449223 RepID=UPI003EDC7715